MSFGHSQTRVYRDVCLGLDNVCGKVLSPRARYLVNTLPPSFPRLFSYFFEALSRLALTELGLSDPRSRNHKSLAIGNHNFEVASFAPRNRSVAITKIALGKNIAAIRNHTLVVTTIFGGFPDMCDASATL